MQSGETRPVFLAVGHTAAHHQENKQMVTPIILKLAGSGDARCEALPKARRGLLQSRFDEFLDAGNHARRVGVEAFDEQSIFVDLLHNQGSKWVFGG